MLAPSVRVAVGIAQLAFALGCGGSPAFEPPRDADPVPQPEPASRPLAVAFAGCREVQRGPVCSFDPEASELRLWAEIDPGFAVVLSFDGVPATVEPEPVDGGQRFVVRPPATARRLELQADLDGVPGRFTLALDPSPARRPAALAELAALRDPTQARRRLQALLPTLTGEARALALELAGDLAFSQGDLAAVTEAYTEGVDVALAAGRIRAASTMAQRLTFVCVALYHDEACAQRWLERDAPLVAADPEQSLLHTYYEGLLAVQRGDLRHALASHQASEHAARALGLGALEAAALLEQMLLVGRLGAWERARVLQERALALEPMLEPAPRAQLLNAVAWMRLEAHGRGHPTGDDPLPLLVRALAQLGEHADSISVHTRHAVRLNLAYAATLGEHAPEARRWLDAVDEAALDPEDRLWRHLLLARVALLEGDPALAERRFATLLSEAERLYEPELRWQALVGQGQVHEARGRPEAALRSYAAADEVLEEQLPRIAMGEGGARFVAERELGTRRWIDLLLRLGRPLEALCTARLSRSRALRTLARQLRRFAHASPAQQQALRGYRETRARLEAAYDESWSLPAAAARQRQRQLAHERLGNQRALDGLLVELDPGSDAAMRCADLPAPGAGALDLHFARLDHEWIGFALDATGVTAHRLGPLEVAPDAGPEAFAGWGRALLDPFAAALARAQQVRVMPAGELMRVPFHALPDPGSHDAMLLDRVTVSYGLDLPGRAVAASQPSRGIAMLVAPTSNLRYAAAELDAVERLVSVAGWQVLRLEGDQALGEAVRRGLPEASLMHYVGHARSDDVGGWSSALSLARDGTLEVGDVLALAHAPATVVLNGCETGRTDPRASAGGMSLAHAFVLAGSELVVATDREIDDAAAAALARAFHEAHAAGQSAPQALRSAQKRRRSHDDGWLHTRGWVP